MRLFHIDIIPQLHIHIVHRLPGYVVTRSYQVTVYYTVCKGRSPVPTRLFFLNFFKRAFPPPPPPSFLNISVADFIADYSAK